MKRHTSHFRIQTGASCALAALVILLVTRVAVAEGSVTPSFGDGKLTLGGEGYRRGERVEITVRVSGSSQRFTAMADARGRFRLETGLQTPPLSRVEIEARDEQSLTQVTLTSGPSSAPTSGGGMPLPVTPSSPARMPTELPRTGETAGPAGLVAGLAGLAIVVIVGGLALRGRSRLGGWRI